MEDEEGDVTFGILGEADLSDTRVLVTKGGSTDLFGRLDESSESFTDSGDNSLGEISCSESLRWAKKLLSDSESPK